MEEGKDGGLNREDEEDATEDAEREHHEELPHLSGAHRRTAPVASGVAKLDVEQRNKDEGKHIIPEATGEASEDAEVGHSNCDSERQGAQYDAEACGAEKVFKLKYMRGSKSNR